MKKRNIIFIISAIILIALVLILIFALKMTKVTLETNTGNIVMEPAERQKEFLDLDRTLRRKGFATGRQFDQFAQGAYDAQFVLPSPTSPDVLVSELDAQIILSWDEGSTGAMAALRMVCAFRIVSSGLDSSDMSIGTSPDTA